LPCKKRKFFLGVSRQFARHGICWSKAIDKVKHDFLMKVVFGIEEL
jgi:hypothetical protein